MVTAVGLKAFFCLQGLMAGEVGLYFDKDIFGSIVNKNAATTVHAAELYLAMGGEHAAFCAADKVIHIDALSRVQISGREHTLAVL